MRLKKFIQHRWLWQLSVFLFCASSASAQVFENLPLNLAAREHSEWYDQIQSRLGTGWGTFNTANVLSHTHLPSGFTANICVRYQSKNQEKYLREVLIGQKEKSAPEVIPAWHSYNSGYTKLNLIRENVNLKIETALSPEGDWLALITQVSPSLLPVDISIEAGYLFNKNGSVNRIDPSTIQAEGSGQKFSLFACGKTIENLNSQSLGPYITQRITDSSVAFCTGKKRSTDEVSALIKKAAVHYYETCLAKEKGNSARAEALMAIESAMAWNTIYDPNNQRVISTVNRIWNLNRGGYGMFCWDNLFGSILCGYSNKELGYANLVESLAERTEEAFISNNSQGNKRKAWDRSQPPIGSMAAWKLFEIYGEPELLKEVYEPLKQWNNWWMKRRYHQGLLCWGSHKAINPFKDAVYNNLKAAALESGLDDSPMYDSAGFDAELGVMLLHDVGLNALYIADCEYLKKIADVMGDKQHSAVLAKRIKDLSQNLGYLYDAKAGYFKNYYLDKKAFSQVVSPTLLYPLMTDAGKTYNKSAKVLIGDSALLKSRYPLPSVAVSHPDYKKQKYWKGSVWAPLNYLSGQGLKKQKLNAEYTQLSNQGYEMFISEYRRKGYVAENYSSISGKADDGALKSEHFYFWAALLPLMYLEQ